ncbi:helix-turn-helix transcriptional regulator [Actinomadura rayongensis]|jgi:DNA-binding NarL/FixJ family response regulator|uniref:DNA-binding response regulator n=1 Tax=Actinomadura rayongensis TaxID=1429076 RepID=A0A6I4WH75_9ACTN|nr:helix-turn-helix transcriptional regulator [Actinomadura rayongensis]MXQ68253.1 DNA-binding response regulator [Actinomadura rayongensis]
MQDERAAPDLPSPTMAELAREAIAHLEGLARVVARMQGLAEPAGAPAGNAARAEPGGLPSGSPHLDRLTRREREVLALLVRGMPNRRIARSLNITDATVKNHLHAVFVKLGVADRTEAVAKVLAQPGPHPGPHSP